MRVGALGPIVWLDRTGRIEFGAGDGKFRPYFTKNGKRYYAKDYGYRSWPFGGSSRKKASPK
ncbi:MAG TPA: hypothetical protein VMP01_05455 [Pirellulaceae bacterium]|nr:hypothetical protein [Pirellulaceae bacterium]